MHSVLLGYEEGYPGEAKKPSAEVKVVPPQEEVEVEYMALKITVPNISTLTAGPEDTNGRGVRFRQILPRTGASSDTPSLMTTWL